MNDLQQLPVARKDNLVIQELPDEILIYDLETNKAHCLNQTAASVWKSCDGKNTVAEISVLITGTSGRSADEDLIWLAIDQLNEKNLLETRATPRFSGQTRREVIKKVGLAAVIALPIVRSLVAPTVAWAGSTCPGTTTCTCTFTTPVPPGGSATCSTTCASPCTTCACTVTNTNPPGGAAITSCSSNCT